MVLIVSWLTLGLIAATAFSLVPVLREEVKADAEKFVKKFTLKNPHWNNPQTIEVVKKWFFWGQPIIHTILGLFSLIEAASVLLQIRITAIWRMIIFGIFLLQVFCSCNAEPQIYRGCAVQGKEIVVVEINPNTIKVLATVPDKNGIKKAHGVKADSIVYDGYNKSGELTRSFVTAFKGGKPIATVFYSRATLAKDFWHGSK